MPNRIKIIILSFGICALSACKDEPIDAAFEQGLASELNELIYTTTNDRTTSSTNDRTTSSVNVNQCTITIKLDFHKDCSQWGDLAKNIPTSTTRVISMKDIQSIRYFQKPNDPSRSSYFFDYKSTVVQHNKDAREIQRRKQQGEPKVLVTNDGVKLHLNHDSFKAAEYLFSKGVNSYEMIGHCSTIGSYVIFPYDMRVPVRTPQPKVIKNKIDRYQEYCSSE